MLDDYVYHNHETMTELLLEIAQNHSDIIDLQSIGVTYEGRDIWAVTISDNPTVDEAESGALFLGAHHGNEKPAYESLIFFINYIAERYNMENFDDDSDGLINEDIIDGVDNDDDGLIDEDPSEDRVREIVDNTQIYVIPMVNPDGVNYDWRKNREPNYGRFGQASEITSYGVDLNRNYGYKWYYAYLFPLSFMLPFIINDNSWNYRGEQAFSENETSSVRDFVSDKDIEISISYHSYGEFVLFPWTHSSARTPDEDLFVSIGEDISAINDFYLYTGGDYLLPRIGGSLGTSENWLYGEKNILSFTLELCRTRAPSNPNVVFDYCMTQTGVNFYVCERSRSVDSQRDQ
jgi:hypothetical protein